MTSQKLDEEHEILRRFIAVVVSSAFKNSLICISGPPTGGRKTGAARKLPKSVGNIFDPFCGFLTLFTLREKCRKVSKTYLTLFDDF